jgi:chromosome segregation protein
VEHESRGAESELGRLVASAHEIDIRATECRVRREELGQEAWRVYGVDTQALLAHHDPARELTTVRERVAELEERLVAIGPVNLVADDEYRELDERLTFLRTQHDDLTASIKDLEKALRGMTRTAQERFVQAFEEINGHFGRLFERLFEGGRAELRLVEAEEGAIRSTRASSLRRSPAASGFRLSRFLRRERAHRTGLAFAIFYFRPSPFCVLDEVDAPLDDANIHRFLRVLRN